MKTSRFFSRVLNLGATTCLFFSGGFLSAQPFVQGTPSTAALRESADFRRDLALGVAHGAETAAAALARLRTGGLPASFATRSDVDYAYAALEVGQRLLTATKPAEAAVFFAAAETALAVASEQTPDTAAAEKAQYLRKLALIRGQYLGKIAEAKADLDRALTLQPEDRALREARTELARTHAEYFKSDAGRSQP